MVVNQIEKTQSIKFLKDQRWQWILSLVKINLRLLLTDHLNHEDFDQKWEDEIKDNLVKIWQDAMKCGYSGEAILNALEVMFINQFSFPFDLWAKIYPILEGVISKYLEIPHSTEDGTEVAKVAGEIQILTRLRLGETLKNLGEFLKPRQDDFRYQLLIPVKTALTENGVIPSLQTAYIKAKNEYDSPARYYSLFLVELINQILRDTGIEELQEIRKAFINVLTVEPFFFNLYDKAHDMVQLKRHLSGGMRFINFKISKDNFSKAELRIESNYPEVDEVVDALNKVLKEDPTFIIPYKLEKIDPKERPSNMSDYSYYKVVPGNPTQCEFLLNLEKALGMKRTAADNKAMLTLWYGVKGFTFTLPSGTLEVPMNVEDNLSIILVAKDESSIKELEKEANKVLASLEIKKLGSMGTFRDFEYKGRLGKHCFIKL